MGDLAELTATMVDLPPALRKKLSGIVEDDYVELAIAVDYTDWSGRRGWHYVVPLGLRMTDPSDPFIKGRWVLVAYDLEKKRECSVVMANVHEWRHWGANR